MAPRRSNYPDIDYYDCSAKDDGNYIHPTDCTRFIMCSNGRASDMGCADCDPNNELCAGSPYLFFNADVDRCEWPAETRCIVDSPA